MQKFYLSSLLDNDFYKFTMQFAVVRLFPRAKARYHFINRGKHSFPDGFAAALQQLVNAMSDLKLTKEERQFLAATCPYLPPTYLDFLEGYRYNANEVHIQQNDGELSVAVEGYWYRTILWEVPLLCLISELYYRLNNMQRISDEEVYVVTKEKIECYNKLGITIAEFGTRRRHSYNVHKIVMRALEENSGAAFVGTSNVHFAQLYNTKPIGTHAHEWFMFHAAKYGYKMANSMALEHWTETYRGDLGIALSDTFTTKVFFQQFDKKFAKLFDGVRHDSGDPLDFAAATVAHYKSLGINPLSKTIIFSDALNFEKVKRIAAFAKDKIGISFGIGTNFTNDVGLPPMNIVMKLTEAYPECGPWTNVVKLSDEKGKYTGDAGSIALAKTILQIEDSM
ncbi:nicotinate phosphoribosyltransferase [Parafilimonas terrae]|uniref:Nicotinate phosphoribosyltransferase n=1 Tax=Parafilimonas terrae TaxID=1465490 RepID=A0A1I5SFP6_9BACT|nr:nicotinate phosphoribosyltransferase [Parafilimonas terrae]SFP69539.1 nicotinate phosphoribosyltransferase [Parafilimonas terrae]